MEDSNIHWETNNVSFLKTAIELKNAGIKNHDFFLKLYDKDLVGVDPYNPLLSETTKAKILDEVVANPWYYIRECVRIPEFGGDPVPFTLHRANLASIFCVLNNLDHYTVTPSQHGRTMSYVTILGWIFNFKSYNSNMLFLNMRAKGARENMNHLYNQTNALLDYLKIPQFLKYNEYSLINPIARNLISTIEDLNNEHDAVELSHRFNQPIHFYDNAEHMPYIEQLFYGSAPVFYRVKERAKSNATFACRIFSSTFGDEEQDSTKFCMNLIDHCMIWNEKIYDMTIDELEKAVQRNATNGIIYIRYTYDQLSSSSNWFENTCQAMNHNEEKIRRQILLLRKSEIANSSIK
jgi:hypothetical protein